MRKGFFEAIREESEAKFHERLLRRKELREKRIDTDLRIVAWIDILGFSQLLESAESEDAYRAVYHRMLNVHEAFDVATASGDPGETNEINDSYGRTVLALSDGLVVAAGFDCDAAEIMTRYDFVMSFVGHLVEAQARCASQGIFLRGAIAIGPFHFEDNVLISPALVKAYKLETKWAVNPVIIADVEEMDTLRNSSGVGRYAEDCVPSDAYFQEYRSNNEGKERRFYHLDYLAAMANPENYEFYCEEDRKEFSDREKYTPEQLV